jgi:tetratricopeptide (TPR) repeat protein
MRLIKLRVAFSLTILAVLGLLGVNQASAVADFAPTAAELRLLPPYCQKNLDPNSTDFKLYSGKLGRDYGTPPHYCNALKFINRYKRSFANKTEQLFYLQSALGEFGYAFTNTPPTNRRLPEMHVQKGKLLAAAKRNVEAVSEFEQALQRDPNYMEAYVALSYLYKNIGQQSKSITAMEQALQRVPNDKSLQRQYSQLTGKVFTPPPPTVEQAAQIPPMPIPVVQAAATSEVNSTTTLPVPASSPVVVPEKIGTPTNPYCRFCPAE